MRERVDPHLVRQHLDIRQLWKSPAVPIRKLAGGEAEDIAQRADADLTAVIKGPLAADTRWIGDAWPKVGDADKTEISHGWLLLKAARSREIGGDQHDHTSAICIARDLG